LIKAGLGQLGHSFLLGNKCGKRWNFGHSSYFSLAFEFFGSFRWSVLGTCHWFWV